MSIPAIALLPRLWPQVAERIGDRLDAFLDTARQCAAQHGLVPGDAASVRFVNLCFVLGPGFERKPENEWALAILADGRLQPWARLHQLVLRARHELRRRGGDEPALARADAALLDALDAQRLAADADATPLPRVACDIEAIELRLLDTGFRHEYREVDGQWQWLPLDDAPLPLRIGQQWPAPARVAVLSRPTADGPGARLQLRQAMHGGCAGERHPGACWIDGRGLTRHQGHAARALSWLVAAPASPAPATGLGVALAEETAPEVDLLQIPSCGLRDEGLPLGAQSLQVWVYPAQQWLFALQRDGAATLHWPLDATRTLPAPKALPASRCRIERDGQPVDATAWLRGFDEALPAALAAGFDRLFEAWQASVQKPTLQLTPGLFTGRQLLSWGWREGAAGLAGEALLRVVGALDLSLDLNLQLGGEIEVGGSRTLLQLSASGQARLQQTLRREQIEPAPSALLAGTVLRFAFPFTVQTDPVALADGIVCSEAGPCSGVLGGELGLRPRLSGGSGWQWYARIACDPVLLQLTVHDPALGATRHKLMLLPALPLLDWSLG